jgi:hypothetical protein
MADSLLLSTRLQQILESIPDRSLSDRLGLVYVAAANAIERLGDMDLVKYETSSIEGAPDLSLWEEMAPVIRDTLMDVNALLTVVREQFPGVPPGGLAKMLAQAIEEAGPLPTGSLTHRRAEEAESALRAVSEQLAQQISQLGERMRSPQIVSDRWNLLTDLQSFRSRFREMIGDLVYLSATAFGEVHRADIVPGYQEEIETAVAVRAAVADLSRLVQARHADLEKAEPGEIQGYDRHLQRDLDAFGKTHAYRALRAQDKRVIIEFRHELGKLAERSAATRQDLLSLLRPFLQFVCSLQRVNQREILLAHDREVWAACGVKLEQAQLALALDEEGARAMLAEAAKQALGLYGRDAALDVFLRKARKGQLDGVSGQALVQEVEKLRELLAGLPMV